MNVLFVCLHNAGRSQMSEALFTRFADGRHQGRSAGTAPAGQIHPEVRRAMAEVGIDLAGRAPKQLTPAMAQWADIVVTMGCGDQCPYIPGRRYIDWDLPDDTARQATWRSNPETGVTTRVRTGPAMAPLIR
jgi:arsenate reductase (thioredoxin)